MIPSQYASSIPRLLSRLAGSTVSALALVCTVSDGRHTAVAAFITVGLACSLPFREAIEREGRYSDALLAFADDPPPFYAGPQLNIDLDKAAGLIGVDRVLCLVAQVDADRVCVVRDYDGLEVTLLEAARAQFERFSEALESTAGVPGRRLH